MGNNRILTETKHGVRMFLDTRDIVITPIVVLRGEWEPETTEALFRLLKPGMNFVDVGANMGYFTCLAGRIVLPGGKVWAFEADPELFELLTDNVALNWHWEGVIAENKAIFSETGKLTLYQRQKYKGNTSIAPAGATDLARVFDRERACEVEAVTLDDYFLPLGERLDLIKIDVEGAEPFVLEGMRALVESHPEMRLLLEWSPGQIAKTGGDPRAVVDFLNTYRFRGETLEGGRKHVTPGELAEMSYGMLVLSR